MMSNNNDIITNNKTDEKGTGNGISGCRKRKRDDRIGHETARPKMWAQTKEGSTKNADKIKRFGCRGKQNSCGHSSSDFKDAPRSKLRRSFSHDGISRLISRRTRRTSYEDGDQCLAICGSSCCEISSTTSPPLGGGGGSPMAPIQEVDEETEWSREKENLLMLNNALSAKVRGLEESRARLQWELRDAREEAELLEFRVLELQEADDGTGEPPGASPPSTMTSLAEDELPVTSTATIASRFARSKEIEFRLKLEAVKCERDETVASLQSRLAEMQQRHEVSMRSEKSAYEELIDRQRRRAEAEKESLIERLEEERQKRHQLQQQRLEATAPPRGVGGGVDEEEEVYEGVGGGGSECLDMAGREREVQLEQKVFELEQKEVAYRATLAEADRIMATVERTYQERVDELEGGEQRLRARITQMEQRERRLSRILEAAGLSGDSGRGVGEANLTGLLERFASGEPPSCSASSAADIRCREAEAREAAAWEKIRRLEESEAALRETLLSADAILSERESKFRETISNLEKQVTDLAVRLRVSEESKSEHFHEQQMAVELQKLSGREEEVRSLGGTITEIAKRIKSCDNCERNCGAALTHLEVQMKQLDEIVFGCHSPCARSTPDVSEEQLLSIKDRPTDMLTNIFDQIRRPNDDFSVVPLTAANREEKPDEGIINENTTTSVRELRREIDRLNSALSTREEDMGISDRQNAFLRGQLETRVGETTELRDEVIRLKQQLRKTDTVHRSALRKLDQRNEELTASRARTAELDRRISATVTRLRALEHVQQERDALQEKWNAAEVELKKKRETEHRLCAENLHLHHKVEGLRERINSLQLIKKEHKSLLTKHSTLEKKLSSAEMAIGPLQSQIYRLKTESRDKDRLIVQLTNELQKKDKRSGDRDIKPRPISFGNWADPRGRTRAGTLSSDDSGIHDSSQGSGGESETSEDSPLSRHARPLLLSCPYPNMAIQDDSSLSGSTSSDVTEGDTEVAANLITLKGRKSRIPRYLPLQRYSSQQHLMTPLKESSSKASSQNSLLTTLSHHGSVSDNLSNKSVVGVTSVSLRRERFSSSRSKYPSTNGNSTYYMSHHVSGKTQLKVMTTNSVNRTGSAQQKLSVMTQSKTIQYSAVQNEPKTNGLPNAPVGFHVTRKIGQDGLLVAWEIPNPNGMIKNESDEEITVSGYQIFVNGILHQKVRSAHRTKALLNNLNLGESLEIRICSVATNGLQSMSAVTKYPQDSLALDEEEMCFTPARLHLSTTQGSHITCF